MKELPPLQPDRFDFDGLRKYVTENNLSVSIGIASDAAKIVENVRFDSHTNSLLGLCAPFDPVTGIPIPNFHDASSATKIHESMTNFPKATMVECVIARPNTSNAPCFLLGYYFTNLSAKYEDKTNRMEFCYNELEQRGLKLMCEFTDGDTTSIGAQKRSMNFGSIYSVYGLTLAVDHQSKIISGQDPEHILKKIKNAFFARVLRIGNKNAGIAHLEIMINRFPKLRHGLTKSDLMVADKMDYK